MSHKSSSQRKTMSHTAISRTRTPSPFPCKSRNESSRATGMPVLQDRIKAFERAAAAATDAQVMASKVSEKSDRKKYDFCTGLRNDLANTRSALRACSDDSGICTFGELFSYTGGRIANLNRILQNLKSAGEVRFDPECFFMGMHNEQEIELLEQFWKEDYIVDETSVFRQGCNALDVPEKDRRGRSYVNENLKTIHVFHCSACSERVKAKDRITVRACVYHLKCITCVACGSNPRRKADYITFDGQVCCSSDCVRQYDGAHVRQERD